MIWDSIRWKDDLHRRSEMLELLRSKDELTEENLFEAEITILVAFYVIRKLIEAKTKLSTKTISKEVPLIAYPATGKTVTLINWHKIEEAFDMDKPMETQKDIRFICNQFVHSYVFSPCIGEGGGLDGVLFCSDQERAKHLFFIDIQMMISLLNDISSDFPDTVSMKLNKQTGDYDVRCE